MGWLLEIPIAADREQSAREAAEELAKAKYHQELPKPITDLLEALQRYAEQIVNLLFGRIKVGDGGGNSFVVIGLIVVVLLAAVGVLIWRFGLPRRGARVPDAAVDTDATVNPEDYRTRAERAADDGDWRTAVQESFRAMVRELEVRTILERRPARTAYETAALIAREWPALEQHLFAAAMTFNEVCYGHRPALESDYVVMRAAETAVLQAADDGWTGDGHD